MELRVLSPTNITLGLVDDYESIIWTERYSSAGDCEIYTPATEEKVALYQPDNFIVSDQSLHGMIIDQTKISRNEEGVYYMTVEALSFESVLQRRIIWMMKNYTGTRSDVISSMIYDAIILPTDTNRRIDNFEWESVHMTPSGGTIDTQYTGTNLYEAVTELCDEMNWGFIVEFNLNQKLSGRLYEGEDRSGEDSINTVTFSEEHSNLGSTEYTMSVRDFKTNALIGGEGEGPARRYTTIAAPSGSQSGLGRREVFIDARDVSSDDGLIPEATYLNLLRARGREKWADYEFKENVEGEIVPDIFYTYGVDYNLGDIVRIEDRFGHAGAARVVEYIWVSDATGVRAYPTFKTI